MKLLLEGHWPWWLGAIGLASVAALMWAVERRLLGVSGSFGRLVTREDPVAAPQPPLATSVHLVFLLAMAAGGGVAAWASGAWQLRFDLGQTYASLVAGGWPMALVLLLGGALTGVGTRMAGGCTSGHGLTGCARLQPASFVATAAFFGTAIAVSFFLLKVSG